MRTRPRPQKSCACTFAGRRKHGQSLTTWSCMESPGFESCAPPTLTEVCKCTPWGGFRGQQCRSDAVHAPDGATGMCAGDAGGAGGAGNVVARAGCTRQERVVFAGRRCAYELLEVCVLADGPTSRAYHNPFVAFRALRHLQAWCKHGEVVCLWWRGSRGCGSPVDCVGRGGVVCLRQRRRRRHSSRNSPVDYRGRVVELCHQDCLLFTHSLELLHLATRLLLLFCPALFFNCCRIHVNEELPRKPTSAKYKSEEARRVTWGGVGGSGTQVFDSRGAHRTEASSRWPIPHP